METRKVLVVCCVCAECGGVYESRWLWTYAYLQEMACHCNDLSHGHGEQNPVDHSGNTKSH